jgi:CRISPR-associated protein Csc1
MKRKVYKLVSNEPIFYSSREGSVIGSSEIISATAIMHALGYKFSSELGEVFLNKDENFSDPNYDRLKNIGFFTSDATPVNVSKNERTFKSTEYKAELNMSITFTNDDTRDKVNIDEKHSNSKGFPSIKGISKSTISSTREFVGIEPDSEFELTIWDSDDIIPDNFSFRCGIKRNGHIRATRKNKKDSKLIVNKFLLQKFDTNYEILSYFLDNSRLIKKGDPRLHHFKGISLKDFEEKFIENNTDLIKLKD